MRPGLQNEALPVAAIDYGNSRREIKNGGILMYRGRSWESRLIRWATRSRYSHAGIAAWWNGRLKAMEAVGKGEKHTMRSDET